MWFWMVEKDLDETARLPATVPPAKPFVTMAHFLVAVHQLHHDVSRYRHGHNAQRPPPRRRIVSHAACDGLGIIAGLLPGLTI
jgi:hypothetical protein